MVGTGVHLHREHRLVGCPIVSMHRCLLPFFLLSLGRASKINLKLRASCALVELEMLK